MKIVNQWTKSFTEIDVLYVISSLHSTISVSDTKKIASKENLDKHQSITKISTLIVKFFSMKHCFQKVNVDKAKFLFNGKSCRSCTFLFLKEGKTLISSNESGIYELKHKHNNNKMYAVRNYISYSLYHINKWYYINNCNTSNLTKTNHAI